MPTLLVTGANRGIGLELARSHAADGWRVIGAVRRPDEADKLRGTGAEVAALDAADPASIAALGESLKGETIDLLIANAGIYGPQGLDPAAWLDVLRTNTLGPVLLARALKRPVSRSEGKRMIAITSGMGSIAETGGGHIPYRSSKAALNMAWRSLALEWEGDGIAMAVINPGWVKTDMGGAGAAITPAQSVAGMRRQIEALTVETTASFLSWDGRAYPW